MSDEILKFVQKHYILLFLIIIVVLGSILRFKGLTFNDHWLDELYSADFSDPSRSFNSMLKITLEDIHPPVYQTLLWLWYKVFGFSEYAGRFLSAIIGTLSIVTIYLLGKELFNKHVGLYAALLTSVNIFLIQYSQETRSYGLFFLLSMLSYLYLYKAIHNPDRKNLILYWIATIVLFYTHYFSFFIVATQLVVIIVYIINYSENKKQLFRLSLLTVPIFTVSILPLVSPILEATRGEGLEHIKTQPAPYYFIGYIVKYFAGIVPLLVVFFGGVISLKYLLTGKLSQKEKFSLILLLIWISLGYFLPYLKSILSTPSLSIRYTISMLSPIILIVSYGLWRVKGWKRYLILSLYFLYSFKLLFFSYYGHIQKDQYREVLQEVVKYKPVPIYERIPYNGHHGNITNHYQTYAKMLKLNMNIQNDINLTKDIKNGNLPECFWVLNAHFAPKHTPSNDVIEKSEIIKNHSIHIVKKINYKNAEGVLLSYKTEPDICAKKVGFKIGDD